MKQVPVKHHRHLFFSNTCYMILKIMAISLLTGMLCAVHSPSCKGQESELLENILEQGSKSFRKILKKRDRYEIQIIYTRIDRDETNKPSFTSYYYNFDHDRYFYPASTVKMPAAFLALERMNELGLARQLFMLTDSAYAGQSAVTMDSTSSSGMPSVEHYIRKIFLVSDNDAYNRLYEFLGQEYILNTLKDKGYTDTRIIHRLSIPLSEDQNRHTNPVHFTDATGSNIYDQPMKLYEGDLNLRGEITKGKGFILDGELVREPMDFTRKNFFPLDEMQEMLTHVLFPEYSPEKGAFNLTNDQRKFLLQYMSQLPGETDYPSYPEPDYYDAYCKFLLFGSEKNVKIPSNIRIFNKIGQAYGYVTDNAYIIDLDKNIEFLLSAVIHTNKNRIYNDGEYEYEETAFPFMKELGQLIYEYELKRPRDNSPDLTDFRLVYDSN